MHAYPNKRLKTQTKPKGDLQNLCKHCTLFVMGQSSSSQPAPTAVPEPPKQGEKPKCKPCCACPETRKARDECIAEKGPENCKDLIEAHLRCMRQQGFNV
ncbi:hypothetical protein ACF0H5_008143 [Mactra antiquata]